MPELPEVEVVRRSLAPRLVGETIARVEARAPALREPLDRAALARDLEGRRVGEVRRRAKYLLVDLDGGATLALHLGMSGRLTVAEADDASPPALHEHLVLHLASGRRLRFVDPRRFGVAFTLPTDAVDDDPHFARLGVEPLGDGFDGACLAAAARRRRGPVKPFLMDAGVVVGVGNIYASEALWAAGLHPKRSVGRISPARWRRIADAVRETLLRAIAQGGSSISDFVDGEGRAGYFQATFAVYDREGLPCPRCGTPVRRFVQAGRSTYHCPGCQT
ncbi:MAG TPA: bifunctional DNA-formamidopyrimidine glycosylase/DNA-(apurinic or apyrimidinic site) lyase [Thermoanaerobaculia bacterium]|nr:bifunctional DNA-formamidopyrimidine glycosylase/DNA-(apurinic or apyrimidinic site) lyase [Thermoanaerobaculia bacterium]